MNVEVATSQSTSAEVQVLPGLPGNMERTPDGRGAYPSTTTDMVKRLREAGLIVEYGDPADDRAEASLMADEFWLPVLVFAGDVIASGAGALLIESVRLLFGEKRTDKSLLHVKIGRTRQGLPTDRR